MNNPLVSVVVVSYNAATTVLETLESIKNQTYQNIELIISDDCSRDETVKIVREWLNVNCNRFINARILTADKNQGVCANCNKGRNAASGRWIKGIAADDILLSNCIEEFMEYANSHEGAEIITSFMKVYNETFDDRNCINENKAYENLNVFNMNIEGQKHAMARQLFVYAPSVIYTKELFDRVGGYDSRYAFEDYPFFLSVLELGCKIHFLDKATVGYRVHQSMCHTAGAIFNYRFQEHVRRFRTERCFKYFTKRKIKGEYLKWKLQDFFESHGMNKRTPLYEFLYWKTTALINKIFK